VQNKFLETVKFNFSKQLIAICIPSLSKTFLVWGLGNIYIYIYATVNTSVRVLAYFHPSVFPSGLLFTSPVSSVGGTPDLHMVITCNFLLKKFVICAVFANTTFCDFTGGKYYVLQTLYLCITDQNQT